jgi:membrane associated rhomboid family serine protease
MAYRGSSYQFGFGLTPWVQRLLIANFAVFVLTAVIPGLMYDLAFIPGLTLVRPWTVLTYMFAHGGFMHLLFNMIGLFFFGPLLEDRWGSAEFIKFYLFCGIGGAAFSFLFAFHNPVVGASAAVYGIMLAFALNWPNMPIYIWGILPIPAKYLVGVLVVMSLMSAFGGAGGNVAHFAHLGGFAFCLIYLKLWGVGQWSPVGIRKWLQRRKMKVVEGEADKRREEQQRRERKQEMQEESRVLDELDRVLEKISTEGMSSLTPAERRLLDEVSRKYRQN